MCCSIVLYSIVNYVYYKVCCAVIYYLAVAKLRKGALSEFASKKSAMYYVTLFVL